MSSNNNWNPYAQTYGEWYNPPGGGPGYIVSNFTNPIGWFSTGQPSTWVNVYNNQYLFEYIVELRQLC